MYNKTPVTARSGGVMLLIITMIAALAGSGCVAVNSFPQSARAGETIMLAVGSPDGMKPGNTSATYTPEGGSAVPVPIRSIFKLYPDKTSPAWLNSLATNVENQTGHGPWTTMIAVDLPTTLVEGTGFVHIATSATYPPPPARNINDASIPLNILPASAGAGSPNPFEYEVAANFAVAGDLTQLEPSRRIVVKPSFTGAGSTTYGAIEVRVTIPNLQGANVNNFQVIADEKIIMNQPSRRVQYLWSIQGSDLVVSFLSPTGGLQYSQAYFYVISNFLNSLIDDGSVDVNTLTATATYYDINGNQVAGGHTFVVIDET